MLPYGIRREKDKEKDKMKRLLPFVFLLLVSTGCHHGMQGSGLTTYAQGILYEKTDNREQAIEAYQKTLQQEGESSYLYVKLGNVYLKDKQSKEAKRCFFRALKLNPKNAESLFGLGVAYLLEDNHKLAARYIEQGLSIEPDRHYARMMLCDILVALEMLEKASQQYEILIKEYPNNYLLMFNYGNLLERRNLYEQAEKAYLSSIQLSEGFWKATVALALLYYKQGKEVEAMEYFRKSIKLNPKDSISYSFLIFAHYKAKEIEAAKSLLEEAMSNGIQNTEFYNLMGIIYSEQKDYLKASEFFKKSIDLQDTSTTRFYLGVVYDKMEMPDKMEEEMKKAIAIDPDNAMALNYLGYSYLLKNKNLQEAYEMIKKACAIEPDNAAFLDSLGWEYYKRGNYKKAKKYLEKAADKEKDEEIYEHLGYLYLEMKEYKKSIFWFIKAYEINKNAGVLEKIEEINKIIKHGIN